MHPEVGPGVTRRWFTGAVAARLASGADTPISAPDRDGMLLVRDRRTFLHGLYRPPSAPAPLKAAAEAGFHVVHGSTQAHLDEAASLGIHRWMTTGARPERIAEMTRRFARHPALLYWETEDEPSYQWKKPGPRIAPEVIRAAYAQLKRLDPQRAVYLNHAPTNLVSTLQRYNPGGDMLGTDIYPVIPRGIREQYALWPDGRQGDLLNVHLSQVGQYMDKLRAVAGPSRCAVMILQAFAWENLREKERDPKMVLYPTRAQLRFMALHSIVRGANGLIWWGLHTTPAAAPLWADLAAVTRELRALDAELAAPPLAVKPRLEYHDTGHSLDRGLEWIVKPSKNGPVLIAVNADPNPVAADIYGVFPAPRRVELEPFGTAILR
jgi:hypothetical protein